VSAAPALIRSPAAAVAAPLDVLLVVDALEGGGAERYVSDLAAALCARGHAVTVACSLGGPSASHLQSAGVDVVDLLGRLVKRRVSLPFAAALRHVVSRRRPDVVHAHIYASAAAAALATVGTSVPLLVTEHTEAPWRGRQAVGMSRVIYRRAARIHVVTSAIADLLGGSYGVPPERFEHVPTAVTPAPRCAPTPAPHWQSRRLIGRVGRLAPEKGIDVFLRAAARIASHSSDAHFLVVGDGPLRSELEALARRLGLDGRIEFLGQRPDARAVIAQLELLVVSSLSDGAPLVVLEARHAHVPVIASAVGGLPDQIRHAHDGLLVSPGNERALAAAITALLEDPGYARRLARNGDRRIGAWTHERLVRHVEGSYRDVLTANALRPALASPPATRGMIRPAHARGPR
jgi:glycosyltransferase involved in cell wall biosynthesis